MYCLARKSVLMLAIVSFLAMVTGLITTLHLLSHENLKEHSPDRCSICQQLLTVQKGFPSQPEPRIGYTNQFKYYNVPLYVTFIERPYFQTFGPRPPPETS
jgi:hypothetical protein